jgi:hypothetical protein
MPGSRLQNVTKLARNEINGLSHRDAVIIWGGSNDINRNESRKGLKYLKDFVNQRKNTNVMIVTAPHRHLSTEYILYFFFILFHLFAFIDLYMSLDMEFVNRIN